MASIELSEEEAMALAGIKPKMDSSNVKIPDFKVAIPWQKEDIEHLSNRDWSANWSEMGCFKTTTGLWMIANKVKGVENPSILIVTSKSGKGTFYQTIPYLPEFAGYEIFDVGVHTISIYRNGTWAKLPGLDHLPQSINFPHIVLSHYDVFSRRNKFVFETETDDKGNVSVKKDESGAIIFKPWTQADYLLDRKWNAAWVDEAHRIKNKDAKWTVALKEVKADVRHASTGTGFINRPDEIWSLLNWLDRKDFNSYWNFRNTFCDEYEENGYRVFAGIKPEMKQQFRDLVRHVGVRRTLTEVMPHIKEPLFVRRDVELSPTQRRMYRELVTELRALDAKGTPLNSPNVLALLSRCRQICVATPEVVREYYDPKTETTKVEIKLTEPSSKLDELMDIIDELEWDEDQRSPVVVFSNFKGPLELFKARLDKANQKARNDGQDAPYPYIHLRQEDNDQERYHKWAVQFASGKYRIFMSTLQLGSESINLTAARHVVFLDRSWSPKDNSQGIGRVRRPGQEGQPVVINIEASATTDQRVEDVNTIKGSWFKQIFGSEGI